MNDCKWPRFLDESPLLFMFEICQCFVIYRGSYSVCWSIIAVPKNLLLQLKIHKNLLDRCFHLFNSVSPQPLWQCHPTGVHPHTPLHIPEFLSTAAASLLTEVPDLSMQTHRQYAQCLHGSTALVLLEFVNFLGIIVLKKKQLFAGNALFLL